MAREHQFRRGHHVRWLIYRGVVEHSTPTSVYVKFYGDDGREFTGAAWQRPRDLALECKFCKRTEGTVISIDLKIVRKGHYRCISAHEPCFRDFAEAVLKKAEGR